MVISPNLREDSRFNQFPTVTGEPHLQFYCGIPLVTEAGYALETLTVMDFVPRELAFEQTEALHRLSRQVMSQLDLRRRLIEFDQAMGDAVNTAALMEANGAPGRINVSESVAGHVKKLFELEPRGRIAAKHERTHEMYFLNRLKPEFSRDADGRIPNEKFVAECNQLHTGFSG